MKTILVIYGKMTTFLTFILSRINTTSDSFKARKNNTFSILLFMSCFKISCSAMMSMKQAEMSINKFYNLRARSLSTTCTYLSNDFVGNITECLNSRQQQQADQSPWKHKHFHFIHIYTVRILLLFALSFT